LFDFASWFLIQKSHPVALMAGSEENIIKTIKRSTDWAIIPQPSAFLKTRS
jgi:hypothetical protein